MATRRIPTNVPGRRDRRVAARDREASGAASENTEVDSPCAVAGQVGGQPDPCWMSDGDVERLPASIQRLDLDHRAIRRGRHDEPRGMVGAGATAELVDVLGAAALPAVAPAPAPAGRSRSCRRGRTSVPVPGTSAAATLAGPSMEREIVVSRTRCSVLHAAPQSRDRHKRCISLRPRLSSAPRRKCGALRSIRGTLNVSFPSSR